VREEELKFSVHGLFELPDLDGSLPDGAVVRARGHRQLLAVYHDTTDLRLARMGITLRYRTGESGAPWHLKLPTGAVGVRDELAAEASADALPAELASLVTAWTRSAELAPVATLRTDRHTWHLDGAGGERLAEVVDDTVSIMDGKKVLSRFREIEVERGPGDTDGDVLARVGARLVEAGAVAGEFTPKVMRALGPRSSAAPDVPAPMRPSRLANAGDAVSYALRRTVRRLLEYDVRVRQAEDDAVHQMRVCCRRLRSDLRTFAPLVDAEWAKRLTGELRWLAAALGGPRDAEVLRARLHRTATADPLSTLDQGAVERVDARLMGREQESLDTLRAALDSERYVSLLELLVDAARRPALTELAEQPSAYVLPSLVSKAWRKLERSAGKLDLDDPDGTWHAARIRAKRARYAAEAAAPVLGRDCARLGRACASVQDVLGEHQDAATAAEVWLEAATSDPADTTLVLTGGRLVERERVAVHQARAGFGRAWKAATRPKVVRWLPR
jgi:CHAD domain-containing protein